MGYYVRQNMKMLMGLFVFISLTACKQGNTKGSSGHESQELQWATVHYHCPDNYPMILQRLVYSKQLKDQDPFAINPDNPQSGIAVGCRGPVDALRALGLTFAQGTSVSYSSSAQVLVVETDETTHQKFLDLHSNLGINISKEVEQASAGNP